MKKLYLSKHYDHKDFVDSDEIKGLIALLHDKLEARGVQHIISMAVKNDDTAIDIVSTISLHGEIETTPIEFLMSGAALTEGVEAGIAKGLLLKMVSGKDDAGLGCGDPNCTTCGPAVRAKQEEEQSATRRH